MSGGFASRPERVASAAGRFRSWGEARDRALAELRARLSCLGDVCGDVEQGRLFAAGDAPAAADSERAVEGCVGVLRPMAAALDRSAPGHRGADESAGESMREAGQ